MTAYTEKIWTTGEQITAAKLNTHVMDALARLAPAAAKATTTDATATTLIEEALSAGAAFMLYGQLIGERDDHSAALHARFCATFRRTAAGNIALAGSTFTVSEDSASAPTMSWAATAPDLAQLKVTGVAGQTWHWKAVYMKGTL